MIKEQATLFMDHIRKNANQYFEGLEPKHVEVQLKAKQERPRSTLYQFQVRNTVKNYGIIVKVPRHGGKSQTKQNAVFQYKPDLFPKAEAKEIHTLGYTALRSIYEYFSKLGDENLGTIRVLDYLPEQQAIFTEFSKDPSLRQLFMKTNRFHFAVDYKELELPLRNVGRWLRLFHEMSKEDNVQVRHANRSEFIEAVCTLAQFLEAASGKSDYFQKITSEIGSCALKKLPKTLPLGLGHGDFAMRNILVGEGSRITVIDTYAKWQAPIYEDIGYFLHALKFSAPHVITQGLVFSSRQLSAYERAFLEGYFENKSIPYPEIRLYEMLSLLDKWSSVVAHYHRKGGKFKKFGGLKFFLTNWYFKKSARRLLKEIAGYNSQ